MSERRTRGATHSFRLSPRACDHVENLGDGRSKYKKGKSAWVSQAICWFFEAPLFGPEYLENGERTAKLVRSSHGHASPVQLLERVEELEKELEQITGSGEIADDEAKHVPQSRGIRAIFHFIRSFRL